jgi:DNA-binding NtrC family response regulator
MRMLNVLVGDDNATVLEALSSMLADTCDVETASGGTEIIKLFLTKSFDAVLLDIVFPSDVTGVQIARKIRSINPRVPILMMSALPLTDTVRDEISGLGAAFCEKPIRPDRVMEFIRSVADDVA